MRLLLAATLCSFIALAAPPKSLMVEGSADYTKTLELVRAHKKDLTPLAKKLEALELKIHPLGCEYVMAPVPAPPPGVKFEPSSMPKDWKGTWGEVAMTFWRGDLTREQYDALHAAAHGKRAGFPSCR